MSRDRRALLLGGCIVLVSWVVLRAIPGAWGSLAFREATVAQRAELVSSARRKLARLHTLDDSVRTLDAVAEALPRMLLVGRDPETAAVDLMRRFRALLESQPTDLVEFEGRRADAVSGPLRLATITAKIETDFSGLLQVLAELEEDVALGVEAVDVEAREPDADHASEHLVVTLGISGWYRAADTVRSFVREEFAR